ncbi:MAG: type 4a pilus biogenesis protein PilO [Rubrobacteraceae bacterium]
MSFNLREMDNRSILLLGGAGILLVAVLAYLLLIGPLLGRLGDSAEERDAKEAQLAQLRAQVAELERVQAEAGELERQLLVLNRRLPEEPEIPTLLVQIEEIAGESGVTQLLIEPGTPGPPEGGGPYSVVPITMTFEGMYEDLQDFLLRSNNLARLVTVNGVAYETIDPEEGEEDLAELGVERLLRVEMEVEVYFQPQGGDGGVAPVSPAAPETEDETETTEVDDGDQ